MCKINLFPQIFFVKDFRRSKQKVGNPQTIFRNDFGKKAESFKFRSQRDGISFFFLHQQDEVFHAHIKSFRPVFLFRWEFLREKLKKN